MLKLLDVRADQGDSPAVRDNFQIVHISAWKE